MKIAGLCSSSESSPIILSKLSRCSLSTKSPLLCLGMELHCVTGYGQDEGHVSHSCQNYEPLSYQLSTTFPEVW